tara:strand:- start:579 stop:752 length:174 start_codon:yes stop_codon:yes gene_type:complete
MIPGVDFYKNMEIQSKQNVGKTVNMKEYVSKKTVVSFLETFVFQRYIDGRQSKRLYR